MAIAKQWPSCFYVRFGSAFSHKKSHMSRNLIAYFGEKPDCKQYTLKITSDSSNTVYDEILLAGNSPFVVTYDTTNTPFEPVRASRASITCVATDYLLDVYSEKAHGTQVVLYDENDDILWTGLLTSNLLSMPQNSCGYETFTIEAQDYLYTLDKFNYSTVGEHKAIVTFRDIMKKVMDTCEGLDKMYVDMNLQRATDYSSVFLQNLTISEKNFFSSDTDEPWNMRQVLDELCRYLGYTAIQYRDTLYLYDMQYHADTTFQTTGDTQISLNGCIYTVDNWTNSTIGSFTNIASGVTLRQPIVMGTGADISLETIYNKIQVKDSFYEIEEFVPDMFNEDKLVNRLGDKWKSNQITKSGKFIYLDRKGKPKEEEKNENEHVYYMRQYDHENYQSVYRDPSSMSVTEPTGGIKVTNLECNQVDDLQTHIGEYDVSATLTNMMGSRKGVTIGYELRYIWYNGTQVTTSGVSGSTLIYLNAGESRDISMHGECGFTSQFYKKTFTTAWYKVDGVTYSLTEYGWTKKYIGGTMVDLATFDKPMSTQKYNYETESSIDFTPYLMIHQLDKPSNIMHPYWSFMYLSDLQPLFDSDIEQYFPCVYKLKSGYYNPMIFDDKAYIAIDASAIWERYNVEYINPDWTDANTQNEGLLGLFNKTKGITTAVPALIFKLKVGNKYWSSSQSEWIPQECCFVVNMSTDKTDSDDTDFTAWWNKEHAVLNNIEWSDWAGCKGYKIPLEPDMDMNQPIEFEIHLPTIIQRVNTQYEYDGMNNYVWVKSLDVQFATKGSEIHDISDVLYQNVIDSGSVNTLSDITCKFTTYPGEGKHSYSNVALDGNLINNVIRLGTDGIENKCEENIIKVFTNQYSTPTIKQTMTLKSYINPLSVIKDPVLDKYFGIMGTTIDYANNSQTMTLIELKPWNVNL